MDINLNELAELLTELVPKNPFDVDRIRLCQKYKPLIEVVAGMGKDIWSSNADDEMVAIRKEVLRDFGALPSTQHNVERHVKYGTIVEATGKIESTVNYYVVARHLVKQEHYRELEIEETDNEPSRRNKEYLSQATYFKIDLLPALKQSGVELQNQQNNLGPETYKRRQKAIKKELKNQSIRQNHIHNFTQSLGQEPKYSSTKVAAAPTIPAIVLSWIPYSQISKTKYIMAVQAELEARQVVFGPKEGIQKLVKRLREHEKLRYVAYLREQLTSFDTEAGNINDVKMLQRLLSSKVDENPSTGDHSQSQKEWNIDVETSFKPVTGPQNWPDIVS